METAPKCALLVGDTNGIVWTLETDGIQRGEASYPRGSAALHAYDASNGLAELYNSLQGRVAVSGLL